MAIYHLHAKTWSKGVGQGAGGHVRYLLRQGPYAKRVVERAEGSAVQRVVVDRAAEVVASYSGHLPAWAVGDPLSYWDAADAYERVNGTVYRELEFALPMELSERRNLELAQAFAEALARVDRGVTPYTLVLHRSARDPELLHCHLMLSDKVHDGYERSPELWFRRAANRGKDPARGGAPKTQARIAQDWLGTVVRPLWAELANAALEQARCGVRIDHRSLEAQRREREVLAEQAQGRGDELAAARHRKAAAILDRPAQPKRGRVLEHGGPGKAPGQARVWARYQEDLVRRRAALEAVLSAEQEAERLRVEIVREREREERRAVAKRELDARRGWRPDRVAIAQVVLASVLHLGQAHRREVREQWSRRQAERKRRVVFEAQRKAEQEWKGRHTESGQRGAPDWLRKVREQEAQDRARREREKQDRLTAQERGPGIRHPDKPRWQVERERILEEAYGRDVASKLGRWYRIEQQGETLVLRNSAAEVTDHGDRVTAAAGNEREIEVMIALARAKGWTRVSLTGSPEFQERAACAFLEAGFTLDDPALEQRARQALEAERDAARERAEREREAALVEQQERETRPGIRHADRSQWAVDRDWALSRKHDYRHAERAERNGFYSRWMDDEQGLFYERKKDGVRFIDQGPVIVAPREERCREGAPVVYVLYAQARGWRSIDILGDEAFRLRAARVALEEGLVVSDPDLTRRAQDLIKAELRRVPQPEVQSVPQPVQRPAPEPKGLSSPLLAGEWKGSTQGSPRAGGPALFTVKDGEASVYHDHRRVDGVVLDPVQTSTGLALRGVARYPDGHGITLIIDLLDRQGRGYGVRVAVKDRDGQIIEKQTGKVEPRQRDLNRTRGHGRGG